MKFGHKHYVPIVKTKEGEFWALEHLGAADRSRMTPVLEVHLHKTRDEVTHCNNVATDLAIAWGKSDPCFIDPVWLSRPAAVAKLFNSARAQGVQAIPVARLSTSHAVLQEIFAAVAQDNRGLMIRVRPDDLLPGPAALNSLIAAAQVTKGDVHLLLDYNKGAMNLAADLALIPDILLWRTLSSASGVFPASLRSLPLLTWQDLPRHCWRTWLAGVKATTLPRKPAFGDYGTRTPGRPAISGGGAPSPNLRYVEGDVWHVQVGNKIKLAGAKDMHVMCSDLIQQPFYAGAGFSAGDGEFHAAANRTTNPGGTTAWVAWSLNHHLVYASQQVRSAVVP